MSQFGLLLVTDEKTIQKACRGWARPAPEPVTKTMMNPFTGKPVEVTSYVPEGIDESLDCAPLDDVYRELKQAKPVCIDFQISSRLRTDFINAATPFLIGNSELGVIMVDRVPQAKESQVVEHFGKELGDYADERRRREEDLSMFVFVYDF